MARRTGAKSVPAAYMIMRIKITRDDGWPEYRQQAAELFTKHGGRNLA